MVGDVHDKLELELRRGVVVLAVLSGLRTLRYGYELRQSLIAVGMPIEEGTLYPLLRRLESQGVLTSQWQATQGPSRRYYVLSDAGADLLDRLTGTWHGITKAMDDILDEGRRDDT
ncbi:PadR family transcriptional regulator [Actinoplanes sp. G11-F43]|uniref:PadR family transcriptional regulator n=1 Tax=Actinoplanes sp. G11-F43 TaxID=3424130 RepID=UPI003D325682